MTRQCPLPDAAGGVACQRQSIAPAVLAPSSQGRICRPSRSTEPARLSEPPAPRDGAPIRWPVSGQRRPRALRAASRQRTTRASGKDIARPTDELISGRRHRRRSCGRTSAGWASCSAETLARQEGPDAARPGRGGTRASSAPTARRPPRRLAEVDLSTATQLARAFSTYFHLANITEQVHRARELRRQRAAEGGWLDQAAELIRERGRAAGEIAAAARPPGRPAGLHRAPDRGGPPLDPGQAARGSPTSSTREAARPPHGRPRPAGPTAGSAELIDLLWQTDELRLDRPDPPDEARNAVYYLDRAAADAVAEVLEDLATSLRELGVELPADGAPADVRHVDRRRPRRQPVRDARR